MKRKPIVLPTTGQGSSKNRRISRKRQPSPVRLTAAFDDEPTRLSTLLFTRRFPATKWQVPALKTPLYWFDIMMVRRKLIVSIPPDTFIVDGRRFKVLAQDHKVIGVGYTRWLVFEQAAVPKGEKP